MDAIEYLNLIDHQYQKAKAAGISRFDVKWGKWSRQMNLELMEKTGNDGPEATCLKYVVVYWALTSQLLEMRRGNSFFGQSKRKKKRRELNQLRKFILDPVVTLPELTPEKLRNSLL